MYIRCWGSRGSIPVSGPEYNRYGGDTTCIEIRSSRNDVIVIDAGSGIRLLGNKLVQEKIKKISHVFTHVHFDHTIGFPFFMPCYQRGSRITIFGKPFEYDTFKETLHSIIRAPYFPVDLLTLPASLSFKDIGTRPFSIGAVRISAIPLNHPNGGLGFRFEDRGKAFVFLTDNELSDHRPGTLDFADFVDFCTGADLLIHDAEFDTGEYAQFKGWGHSTYPEVVDLGIAAGAKKLGLFHINNRRTDKEMDGLVAKARALIRKRKTSMECFGVGSSFEITL
ncbi:MAG: MBL fold metallo-hydrolase [Chitinispirillaceae bacterium]|nr:MBL fold metallo-hydrolase [Chitinispirillaceae bacterium]